MLFNRLAVLLVGLTGMFVALGEVRVIFDFVLYAWAGLGAAFGPPLLLSLRWRRTSRAGVLAGLVTGTVVVLAWYNIPALKSQLYELVPGFVLSFAATVVFSLLRPDRSGTGKVGP